MDWEIPVRESHYLAFIISELRNISQMFAKTPKWTKKDDFILKPTGKNDSEADRQTSYVSSNETSQNEEDMDTKVQDDIKRGYVVVGSEEAKTGKWAIINQTAKMAWSARLSKFKKKKK